MGAIARRVGWGLCDQLLSSASNFALSAFVAATVSATAFGGFTLVYAIYGVCVGLSGGLASIPLVVRYSAADPIRYRAATRASVGTALVVGTLGACACLAAAPFTSAHIAAPLRALAFSLPGLLVQDAWRYSFVTGGEPAKAAVNDALWVAVLVIGSASLLAAGQTSATSMVMLWGGAATAAAVLGCRQARLTPAPGQALAWLREQRGVSPRYAVEALIHRSGWWLVVTVVGIVAGLQVVASLRGALLLLGGPLNLIFAGTTFVFVSEGVRLVNRSPALLPRAMGGLSAAATAATVGWCGLVLLLPDSAGRRLLGATWPHAEPLLAPLTLLMVALAVSLGAVQGMLSLGDARRSLFTQWAGLAADLPSVTGAAVVAGARGAALASGLSAGLRTVLAWNQFRRAMRDPDLAASRDAGQAAVREATVG